MIIPTYNDADVLPRAVESVLTQTFTDFELIVVVDGSTDGTETFLRSLPDERVQVVRLGHKGVSAARNAGVEHSRGEYVIFLDSDDVALPNWLERLADAAAADQSQLLFSGYHFASEGGTSVKLPEVAGGLFQGLRTNWLAGSFAVRREVYEAVGGYDTKLGFSENTELGIRLSDLAVRRKWRTMCIDEPLMIRNDYGRKPCRAYNAKQLYASQYIVDRYASLFVRLPQERYHYLSIAGVNAVRLGKYWAPLRLFARALLAQPGKPLAYLRFLLACCPLLRSVVWRSGRSLWRTR